MIKINSLNKYFNRGKENEIHVINDISLDLPERGMVAIFGKSGCGKTTLLNVIGGLDSFSSGSLEIDGADISGRTDEIRNKYVGYVFQNYNLNKSVSCFDNVSDALMIAGMRDAAEIERRTMTALKCVDMEKYAKRLPDTLSGGQQQRIAIARAIVKNPRIILADEPTGNLDEANTVMIMNLLRAISLDHLVILVTHEENLVDYYCDKVIELSDGKVVGIKDNDAALGYKAKDKNDIYLGELSRTDFRSDATEVEYYGDKPDSPIKITIVNKNGQIYIKLGSEKIRVIDETSEVKLREGVFEETIEASENDGKIDTSALPRVESDGKGKLFSLKSSIKSGFFANFKNKKKSNKLLYASMCMFAAVTVLMSAIFGTAFAKLMDASDSYNHNVFYLYTDSAATSEKLNSAINDPSTGIDYIVLGGYYSEDTSLSLKIANFETFESNPYNTGYAYSSNAVFLGMELADKLELVAGSRENLSEEMILLTTKVADNMLEKSTVGYIKDYTDLIGMTSHYSISHNGKSLKVAGIVKSNETAAYISDSAMASLINVVGSTSYSAPESQYPIEVADKETVLVIKSAGITSADLPKIGEKVMIQGAELTVKDIIEYTSQNSYVYWLNRKVPDKILNPDEYFIAMTKTAYPDLDSESTDFSEKLAEIRNEFYFAYSEYYYRELDAFLRDAYISSNPSFELWLYITKGVDSAIYYFIEDYDYLTALTYKQKHGRLPTKAEYDAITDTSIYDVDSLMNYKDLYLLYENEYYSLDFQYHPCTYIVSDETYKLFSKRIGETHPSARTDLSDRYTVIHSTDPSLTEAWLTEHFGTLTNDYYDVIVTPNDVWQKHVSTIYTDIISSIVTIAVILAILCICMYFIMRSSLMNRIKEIGIYRAIGVSKKNLVFKFLIESLVLAAFTVFLGYIGTSIFIAACLNSSPMVSDIFFYPAWYALIDFAILLALTTVCGILPILSLVRKTPSEILAKYDI